MASQSITGNGSERNDSDRHRLMCCDRKPDRQCSGIVRESAKRAAFIRLYIGQFKEQLYISVSNATNETVRKLDEEYITHKRGNHGHGLKRINLIVEKYDGFINRKNEAGVFVTEIMLPL